MATRQYELVRLAKTPTSLEFSNCLNVRIWVFDGRPRCRGNNSLVLAPP